MPVEEALLPKDLAAAEGMVNVQINGVWHRFPKGTRLIEAIGKSGDEVPHYCYHPKLSSPGNCRMCMVEIGMPARLAPGAEPTYDDEGYLPIQWMPRPAISCATMVSENLGVRTKSTLVEEARHGVMEFLLANHPLDCPICDQAGECRLQEFAVGHGRGGSRFVEQKTKKPKNVDIGPRIRLDDERCIMCSRCIRFMDEVAMDPVLGFSERGGYTTLGVHPGRKLDHNYGLNTVDICPVGALTCNDFRFQMRVWFLKETPSIDTNCGTGINTVIWTRNDQVYRITPRENNDVNSCWMPDSHRLNFHYLHGQHRLTSSLVRDGDHHRSAPSHNAAGKVASALKSAPKGTAALVVSSRLTNEEMFLAKRLAEKCGISAIATVPREGEADDYLVAADRNPNTQGFLRIFGDQDRAATLQSLRDDVRSGKIRTLLTLQEDLLAPEAGFTQDDLEKLDFLASLHLLDNGTAAAADVVLAGSGFPENRGSMINVTGRLQRLNRAINPPGEALTNWEWLATLLRETGADVFDGEAAAFKALAASDELWQDLTLARIPDNGIQLYETGIKIPLVERERERIARGEING